MVQKRQDGDKRDLPGSCSILPLFQMMSTISGKPRWFQFHNCVAVQSVIRNINPYAVYFYYENLPKIDKFMYNNWLEVLKQQVPFLYLSQLKKDDIPKACGSYKEKVSFVKNLITDKGGIYFGTQTWITNFPLHKRAATSHNEKGHL